MRKVIFGKFYIQIKKNKMMTDVISLFLDLKISNFVKLNIGYYSFKF